MSERDQGDLRAWVAAWRRAGPELERIRRAELRAFDPRQSAAIVDALLEIGYRHGTPRTTSGLIEQQRLFMKARQ